MGGEYRKSSHTTYRIEAHIVWLTKYRHPVLKGAIAIRCREHIRRICAEEKAMILSGAISPDHVHILISYDPSISISHLVKFLKGKTSRWLQMEFKELGKKYWGQHLWARGYFAVSVGNVSKDLVAQYIQHHFENPEDTPSFTIERS